MPLTRIDGYQHLRERDLVMPPLSVFFDPPDTEVTAWVAADLFAEGTTVFDLGCGSGAATDAVGRLGQTRAIGIDSSAASIEWAQKEYQRSDTTVVRFVDADFVACSPDELIVATGAQHPPSIVVSNPAYVPLPRELNRMHKSIYGGPEGLAFLPAILRHAKAWNAELGLVLGSYCAMRRACQMLGDRGYRIGSVTVTALELGAITRAHPDQILALEAQGEAILWRPPDMQPGYLIVGLACTRALLSGSWTPDDVCRLLAAAANSTRQLEGLDEWARAHPELVLRVVVLPRPSERQHW